MPVAYADYKSLHMGVQSLKDLGEWNDEMDAELMGWHQEVRRGSRKKVERRDSLRHRER